MTWVVDASAVGPWFISGLRLDELAVGEWPLPERLGASGIEAHCSPGQLLEHLRSIRTVSTGDGGAFYLRFADMRALSAMLAALGSSAAQRRRLLGPIVSWSFMDRAGKHSQWIAPDPALGGQYKDTRQTTLVLSGAELDRLEAASLADRLAAAVEELDDNRARPQQHADQFALVAEAAGFVKRHGIDSFVVQRAIARKVLEEGGAFLNNGRFVSALPALVQLRDAEPAIVAWRHDRTPTTP